MVAADKCFGFLNIYKPVGMTSHDVVARVRKILKIKQVGHTGTLDPFAEGVLPICIGKATRLIEYLADDKEYIATIQFGKATTTYDLDGEVVFSSDKKVIEDEIISALNYFSGEIEQLPPLYSAIKVKGKKLYEYAREGKDVQIKSRKVFIERIELQKFDFQNQTAQILVKCSKGTYIRSIAHDLGERLGVGGYLIKLVRTQAGKFRIESAMSLEKLEIDFSSDLIVNPLHILDLVTVDLNEDEVAKIRNGHWIKKVGFKDNQIVILIYNNAVVAVGEISQEKIIVKKVFL